MFRQGKQAVKKPAQQNVVIIYADDLGFGDLGCYGSRKIDTPNLDRLCAEGLKFTNAYSTSAVCTPARFSILTGRYPFRNDQAHILPGDAGCIIKRELDTVPKLFQRAGYHTGIVGKWHLGLGDGSKPIDWNQEINLTPIDLGFEESFIFPATADRVPCVFLEGRSVVNLDPKDPIEVSYEAESPFEDIPTYYKNPELLRVRSSHGHDKSIVNGIGRIGYMRGGSKAVRCAVYKVVVEIAFMNPPIADDEEDHGRNEDGGKMCENICHGKLHSAEIKSPDIFRPGKDTILREYLLPEYMILPTHTELES